MRYKVEGTKREYTEVSRKQGEGVLKKGRGGVAISRYREKTEKGTEKH